MDTIYELPATLQADLERLREETGRFAAGEISATEYRAFRVPQGIYEQRKDGTFMLRIRVPAGGVLPHQMRKLAEIAGKYGSGRLHVTTRQDIQVHDVPLDAIHPALVELYPSGLSSRGGGGNTVRNVTACADAGVCADELFDVAPYAVAMTEFMLSDPLSYQLPRKYKIAFSGCSADCIGATVNDVGFIAKQGPSGPGFAVYVGGGMGPHPLVAQMLEEFVPVSDVFLVAEAVKRVFDKHGNRKNKHKARLRYVVEDKGIAGFKELYSVELSNLREQAPSTPDLRELATRNGRVPAASTPAIDGFDIWQKRNVRPQKQDGYHMVHVPIFLGDLDAETFEKLADVIEACGDGFVRTTASQNLIIRWVTSAELPGLHSGLSALGLAASASPMEREMIACTGAATCRLGICLSQGLARAVRDEIHQADLDLHAATDLTLYMNGCPNACGRHPIGSIALFGAARRVNDRLVPYYVLQLGGRVGEGRTRLAQGKETLPARNVPAYLVELLRTFRGSKEYPDFNAFLESAGADAAANIAAKYKDVPSFKKDRNYYYDWDAEDLFSFAGRGPGECSAGVFDLIDVDLASARQALDEGKLLAATTAAARALLITRGEQARDTVEALGLFEKHFVLTGLVDGSIGELIAGARKSAPAPGADGGPTAGAPSTGSFNADAVQVGSLISAVETLYENMDQSLRFKPVTATVDQNEPRARQGASSTSARADSRASGDLPGGDAIQTRDDIPSRDEALTGDNTQSRDRKGADTPADSPPCDGPAGSPPTQPPSASSDIHVDREADFHGVTCPLNYVKTKLLLGRMQQGQVLSVLLDEAGGRSVPRSAEKDGHEVLSEEKQGDRWRVVIRKA